MKNVNYKGLISKNLNKLLSESVGFDINFIDDTKSFIENAISSHVFQNGNIAINFNWPKNIIEMYVFAKLTIEENIFRGGLIFKIYLNDKDSELLLKVKKICKALYKYSGKKIPESIKEILLNSNSFNTIGEVINNLGVFSTIAEEVILFTIVSPILGPNIEDD